MDMSTTTDLVLETSTEANDASAKQTTGALKPAVKKEKPAYGLIEYFTNKEEGLRVWLPKPVRQFLISIMEDGRKLIGPLLYVDEAKYSEDIQSVYRKDEAYPASHLLTFYDELLDAAIHSENTGYLSTPERESFKNLMTRLKEEYERILQALNNPATKLNLAEAIILLNSKDKIFQYKTDGVRYAYKADSAQFISGWSGAYIQVSGFMMVNKGEGFSRIKHSFKIPAFAGFMTLAELGFKLLKEDDSDYAELITRGKRIADLLDKSSYVRYEGSQLRRTYWRNRAFPATGRIMIDATSMRLADPDYEMYFGQSRYGENDSTTHVTKAELTDSDFASLSPFLYGFSFISKQWGEFYADNIFDINFRSDAYDNLVLDEERKELMFSLVEVERTDSADFIDGKGGGTIFLLEGKPGKHIAV
jgi:hypothetical protein